MKITRKDLNLIIERYLLEQEAGDEEAVLDDEEGEELDDLEAELDAGTDDVQLDDEDAGGEELDTAPPEPEDEPPELINLKLNFTLPNSSTKAKVNIANSVIQVVFEKSSGEIIDLNQELANDVTKEETIENDIKGTMMAAIEKIKDPVDNRKIRVALAKMLDKQEDISFIEGSSLLKTLKRNVVTKYGKTE